MKNITYLFITFFTVLVFSSCINNGNTRGKRGLAVEVTKITINASNILTPTLVVILNWDDIADESDPLLWHNKVFDLALNTENSVNKWYSSTTNLNVRLTPVNETSGTQNDGVIIVNMKVNHPGSCSNSTCNDIQMRDIYLRQAIMTADTSVDFSSYDSDSNGYISSQEMQIIFIVAGGEGAYSGAGSTRVWAHVWHYEGNTAPTVDGVILMKHNTDPLKLGSYAMFGATHGFGTADSHKATIGIIVHEIGHSLYNLVDLYDIDSFGGSGLGHYDMMSNGAWGQADNSQYPGETPTQFSSFSKIDASVYQSIENITTDTIAVKCSANEQIKIPTLKVTEYFLIECRDSARIDSDTTFNYVDTRFTTNRLFALVYHVDETKETNNENGIQTKSNHYKVRVVEKETRFLMTNTGGIEANLDDVYMTGDVITSEKTKSYEGIDGKRIEILSSDYTNRTMTFKITQ